MKLWKKLTGLALVLALMLGMTGCLGNVYKTVLTVDGEAIEPGLYLMMQLSAYSQAEALVENSDKDVLKQKVEGMNATKWIRQRTEEMARRYVLVQRLAKEKGVLLSEDSWENINSSLEYWDYFGLSEYYYQNGVGYDNWLYLIENSYLDEDLFVHLYGEGGELAPTDAEMKQRYAEKRVHVRYLSVPLSYSANAEDADEKDPDEIEALGRRYADEMLAMLQSGEATLDELHDTVFRDVYADMGREYSDESDYMYTLYLNPDSDTYGEGFGDILRAHNVGDFGINESGLSIMVYEVIELFESDEEFEENRETVLYVGYHDDYEAYLAEQYEAYKVSKTFGAVWYYSPKKITSLY